jgi:hypothetical protein
MQMSLESRMPYISILEFGDDREWLNGWKRMLKPPLDTKIELLYQETMLLSDEEAAEYELVAEGSNP